MKGIKNLWQSMRHLAFPNVCEACQNELVGNEYLICLTCWHELPKTNYHMQAVNPLAQKFLGRVNIQYAASYCYFNQETAIQDILHALKYRKNKEIGIHLGKRYAQDLSKSSWIQDIDCIIPIPLSKQKIKKRGFNQSEFFGLGLSEELNIEMNTNSVLRIKNTRTQTKMNTFERLNNVANAFEIQNPTQFNGKHVLLIDDVVTTGATLESCIRTFQEVSDAKISIATIAYTIN